MEQFNQIGFFDSGVGGLSIWREVIRLIPNVSTVYLADTINAPYGPKPKDELLYLSQKNVDYLIQNHSPSLIVSACNTATTNNIHSLRNSYSLDFVGVEPGIKVAVQLSKTHKIGVLATASTLKSEMFHKTKAKYSKGLEVFSVAGTGLVEIVESGDLFSIKSYNLVKKYTKELLDKGVDQIVLGCTHYPFLKSLIQSFLPNNVNIIDVSIPVAKRVQFLVQKNSYTEKGIKEVKHIILTNKDNTNTINNILSSSKLNSNIEVKYLNF